MPYKKSLNLVAKDFAAIVFSSLCKPISIGSKCLKNYTNNYFTSIGFDGVFYLDKCECKCCKENKNLKFLSIIDRVSLGEASYFVAFFDNTFFFESEIFNSISFFLNQEDSFVNFGHYIICNKDFFVENVSRETFSKLVKKPSLIDSQCKKKCRAFSISNAQDVCRAEKIFQNNLRKKLIKSGVQLISPETFFCSQDVNIESGVKIHQSVSVFPNTVIKSNSEILPFTFLNNAVVESGSIVGPYASVIDSNLGENSVIGSFVEIKRSNICSRAKIKHLSYIGDTKVCENVNIGAGCVVCNYDGAFKHKTTIDKNSFIGSNCCLVAPLIIGEKSIVAAGSVLTHSIPESSVAISRPEQKVIKNKADALRRMQKKSFCDNKNKKIPEDF